MLTELHLPPLQDRRKANRLAFFYKVVEGLVPALQCHDLYQHCSVMTIWLQSRVNARSNQSNLQTVYLKNIIDRQSTNNSKCFKTVQCNTKLFKNFFPPGRYLTGTILKKVLCVLRHWTASEKLFLIGTNIHTQLSPRRVYAERPCDIHIQIQMSY